MTDQAMPKKQPNAIYIIGLTLFVVLFCGYVPMWILFFNITNANDNNSHEIPASLLSFLTISPWIGFIIIPAVLAGLFVLAIRHKDGADGKDVSDEFWGILLTAFGVVSTSYAVMFSLFGRITSFIPTPGGGLALALFLFGCPPVVFFLLMGLRLALLPRNKKLKGWYGIGVLLTFVLPPILIYLGLI
ncbi:MAG: hypothetical protein ACXW4U_07985 [Anaerolineales bacterium]